MFASLSLSIYLYLTSLLSLTLGSSRRRTVMTLLKDDLDFMKTPGDGFMYHCSSYASVMKPEWTSVETVFSNVAKHAFRLKQQKNFDESDNKVNLSE